MASRISSSSSSRVPSRSHAAGQVRHVCRVVVGCPFDYDGVFHGLGYSIRPDCFKMLFHVPGDRSSLGLPGMVTRPGLTGCLYCRWLPLVRTNCHPSLSISSIASLTFGTSTCLKSHVRVRWRFSSSHLSDTSVITAYPPRHPGIPDSWDSLLWLRPTLCASA